MDNVQSNDLFGPANNTTETALISSVLIFASLFVLLFMIVTILSLWRVYTKAGEPGWKALIPVYNNWVFLRLGGQSGWWAIAAFIPFVNIVSYIFTCIAACHIGLKLQKEGWFVILYIFFPLVWYIWLAFDKSTWQGVSATPSISEPTFQSPATFSGQQSPQSSSPVPPNGPFSNPVTNSQDQNQNPPQPPTTPVIQ